MATQLAYLYAFVKCANAARTFAISVTLGGVAVPALAEDLPTPAATTATSPAVSSERVLPFPSALRALESIEPALSAAYVDGEALYTIDERTSVVVRGLFRASGKTRVEVFGELLAQRRLPPLLGAAAMKLRGVYPQGTRLLLLDGLNLAVHEVSLEHGKVIIQRSLVWDQVRPARDRGGEATRSETAELRAAVRTAMMRAGPLKLAGMSPVPSSWGLGPKLGQSYLAALRLPGFTVGLIECGEESSACSLTRICRLGAGPKPATDALTGIAIQPSGRDFLLADAHRKLLHRYRFSSCYASTYVDTWRLPERIKSLSNVAIDADDRLWITASAADNYLNASLYAWDKGVW